MTTPLGVRTRWTTLRGSYLEDPTQAFHQHIIWVATVTATVTAAYPIVFTGIFFTTSFHLDLLTITSTPQLATSSFGFSTFNISVSFINNIDMMITL